MRVLVDNIFHGIVTVLPKSTDEKFFDELNSRVEGQEFEVANVEKQFALFALYEAIGAVRMEFREIEAKHGSI